MPSIVMSLARALKLEIKNLKTVLDLEATGGLQDPYLGYIEMQLKIPEVRTFERDVLMLVVPDSPYCETVPVAHGTLHRHAQQTGYLGGPRKNWSLLEKGCSDHQDFHVPYAIDN